MCFTLRLHMSAAPSQGGLTQALASMKNIAEISEKEVCNLAKRLRKKLFAKPGKRLFRRKRLGNFRYEKYVKILLANQGGTCLFADCDPTNCWNSPKDKILIHLKLEWGRIHPGLAGGEYRIRNLALLCARCNNQIQSSRTLHQLEQELSHKLKFIRGLLANNSFKPTPHRGVGHVPTLR
jgi:hypothetical protein